MSYLRWPFTLSSLFNSFQFFDFNIYSIWLCKWLWAFIQPKGRTKKQLNLTIFWWEKKNGNVNWSRFCLHYVSLISQSKHLLPDRTNENQILKLWLCDTHKNLQAFFLTFVNNTQPFVSWGCQHVSAVIGAIILFSWQRSNLFDLYKWF